MTNRPIYKLVEWMKEIDDKMEEIYKYSKWDYISMNINGIDILKENKDKINWMSLSLNENGYELLKNNIDKIYF
mgnify:CR=1 FL=1